MEYPPASVSIEDSLSLDQPFIRWLGAKLLAVKDLTSKASTSDQLNHSDAGSQKAQRNFLAVTFTLLADLKGALPRPCRMQ
jgi:hypothetical protein